ncbi:MAG: type II secretion system protein GspM [Betaproteobacteria bacterium]
MRTGLVLQSWNSALHARWARSSAREQQLVRIGLPVLLLALAWFISVGPSLQTLRTAHVQDPQLRAQLQEMLQLQAQAHALQAPSSATPQDAKTLLEASTATLGASARLVVLGDRATASFQGSSADALAQWLSQARLNAHALPLELHLDQSQGLWSGSVVLQLPSRTAP